MNQRLIASVVILLGMLRGIPAGGAEYFVATTGSDANPGTLALPFASIARGQQAVVAGDTVWLRGGVYQYTAGLGAAANAVLFNKSGTSTKPINYFAYPGETPAFDFFNYLPQERIKGFSVQADWLHFRGIELRGVQQTITNVNESWGIRVENGADNNVFEQLNLHHNEGPGFFIQDGGNNRVLNSDSHHNYDPDRGGGNADGFGSHSNDNGNVFIGNRAWENSDDGYDAINSRGQVTIKDSWSWRNGWRPDSNTGAGNGAGFKAGGFGLDSTTFPTPANVPTNVIENSLAFNNRAQGFYANHHPGGINFVNNTAFGNPRGFDLTNDVMPDLWPADHYLRNNVSYGNSTNLSNANQALIDDEFNTWNLPGGATAGDFLSLSSLGVDGPRGADGSLPVLDFMRLAETSQLIDAGMNVGLTFNGLGPDLGAFESGMPGDFNDDGIVDAADFTIWRDNLGGIFTPANYQTWRESYGNSAGGGGLATVPEPGTLAMLAGLIARCVVARRRVS